MQKLYFGETYEKGIYVKRDINKAINYYLLASDLNEENSQVKLGMIYQNGIGVQQDINKAIKYYSLSAKQNNKYGQLLLAMIEYQNGNLNNACNNFYLSAKNGNVQANFIFGFLNHQGIFIEQNIQDAIKYYKYASCFNDQYAKNNLGVIFKNGFCGVEKNLGLAI